MSDGKGSEGKTSDAVRAGAAPSRPGSYSAEELAELERRERLGRWLLLFFAGAALTTAALALYLFSEDIEQNDQYVRIDRTEPGNIDDSPFTWGETPEEPAATATERTTGNGDRIVSATRPYSEPQVPEISTEGPAPTPPPPPSEPLAPTFTGPPPGSVDRETVRALRSGEPQLWREKGQRGYVLVSDAVSYGSRVCRQVSYTRFEQGTQTASPSSQWCSKSGSTRWRPDPRGPE